MTQLNSNIIAGFVRTVLSSKFETPVETPDFHKEAWDICCSKYTKVAVSAPRGHAKTTGITVSYGLATLMFRQRKFMLLVSDTEAQAMMFLGFFKEHLQDNDALINLFNLRRDDNGKVIFLKDTESDIIVQFQDGHKFRIIAKGAEQKLRGLIWNGTRPDIILCHEQNTDIYTPETGWIKNQDYPNAKHVFAHEAYKITFDDGHDEVVSGDHRFLTKSGWKYTWELTEQDEIETDQSTINAIWKETQKSEQRVSWLTTISQKLKQGFLNGIRTMLIACVLRVENGQKQTKNVWQKLLTYMLKRIQDGKLHTVLNADHVSSKPFLLGLPK
jgi:hypothetical protein